MISLDMDYKTEHQKRFFYPNFFLSEIFKKTNNSLINTYHIKKEMHSKITEILGNTQLKKLHTQNLCVAAEVGLKAKCMLNIYINKKNETN